MINFTPHPIALQLGTINIYWYGIFAALALIAAIFFARFLAGRLKFPQKEIEKLLFPLIVFGLIGARLYHVFNEISYYQAHLLDIFKVWHGGLAIHGAVLGGVIILIWEKFFVKQKIFPILDIFLPSLILGQAIGRFGNFFNQELYGRPTTLFLGIFIDIAHRQIEYVQFEFFHPVFFYQFLWNAVFAIGIVIWFRKGLFAGCRDGTETQRQIQPGLIFSLSLIWWSLGRFLVEFLRIDQTPHIFGMRLPQLVAFLGMIIGFALLMRLRYNNPK